MNRPMLKLASALAVMAVVAGCASRNNINEDEPSASPFGIARAALGQVVAQRQQAHAEGVNLALQRVDRGVAADHLARQLGVAPHQRIGAVGHLALGQPAHAGDQVPQAAQVFLVGLHDAVHFASPSLLSRSGR